MFAKLILETIQELLPMLLLFIIAIGVVKFLNLKSSRKKIKFGEEIIDMTFILYILILFTFLSKTDINALNGINLVPFNEILRHQFGTELFFYNVIGNIIAFIPLAILISLKFKPKKLYQVLIPVFIISFSVEAIQYNIGRTFDVDDIFLNVIGGIVGYYIYQLFSKLSSKLPNIFNTRNLINLILVLLIVGLTLYILHMTGVLVLFG